MVLDCEKTETTKRSNSVIGIGYRNAAFDIDTGPDTFGTNGKSQENIEMQKNDLNVGLDKLPEEKKNRDQWANSGFLMSCISMSVGLGNVWRFPFVCLENGGGAFLIPYIIVLILVGRPIYFMEMCLGQFSSYGPVRVWNILPIFRGVGWSMMIACSCVMSYYCAIMAISAFYFVASIGVQLPWSSCDPTWEEYCSSNGTFIATKNITLAHLYYKKTAFPQKDNIDDGIGLPNWRLSICLLVSWSLIFLALCKGVKSSGRVAYFTALFPYSILTILLIRGVTLEGALNGIIYFILPQWDKLFEAKVWFAAVSQCFFSLATGFGIITMLASYNPFRHNVYRDALIISLTDTLTSLLAGITIFSVLGNLAFKMQVDIRDVAEGGPGLIFIYYPSAIAKIEFLPQVFSLLFFVMIITIGAGSMTALSSILITIICDEFPKLIRWKVTCCVCIFGFFSGLIYLTPGGGFMITLVSYYGGDFIIYLFAMIEVGAVSWIYGMNNFCQDIEFMLGIKIGMYWKICWKFIIPLGLFGLLVYSVITSKELTHEGVAYPLSAIVNGYLLLGIGIVLIPIYAMYTISIQKATTFRKRLALSLHPIEEWGPADRDLRTEWISFKARNN